MLVLDIYLIALTRGITGKSVPVQNHILRSQLGVLIAIAPLAGLSMSPILLICYFLFELAVILMRSLKTCPGVGMTTRWWFFSNQITTQSTNKQVLLMSICPSTLSLRNAIHKNISDQFHKKFSSHTISYWFIEVLQLGLVYWLFGLLTYNCWKKSLIILYTWKAWNNLFSQILSIIDSYSLETAKDKWRHSTWLHLPIRECLSKIHYS